LHFRSEHFPYDPLPVLAILRKAFQRTLRGLGLRLAHLPTGRSAYDYVYPLANYAPWNSDPGFLSAYESIQAHTLVDIYRCWELWTLVSQTEKLGGGILEVGVWRGGTGALMAKRAQLATAQGLVYLCDTFEGVVKAGSDDAFYKGGEHSDTTQRIVEGLVQSLNLNNVRILKGIFPDDTAHLVDSGARFRLCHIDVDVYSSARDVMTWVWERMVPGGMVVYDDYGFSACKGITKYVNEQASEADRLVLHNLNGHAIVIRTV
jgi:O-methyltransferase